MSHGNEAVPKYGLDELKNEMNKYGVEITQTVLKNPTTEDIQGVYSVCIKFILNKDINNIRIEEFTGDLKSAMPSVDGIQILPNEGKNHLQAIGNLRFIRYCEKINKILNVENNLSYIFKPVSSHMNKLLCSFIHFMKYREDIYNENEIKIKKIKDKKNQDSVLETELKSVDAELNHLSAKHEDIKNSIITEKNTKKDYEEEIIENQNLLNAQQSKNIQLKLTKDKIVNETNELVFQYSRLRQKKEDLEDQIVPSPEKLQEYNEELKALLSEHMSYYESDKKKNEDIKSKIMVADTCIKKLVELLTSIMNHVDNNIKVHIDKKNDLKSLEKTLNTLDEEKEELLKKKEEQDEILDSTQQNYEQEQNKWNQKIEEEEAKNAEVEQTVTTIYENVENINMKINMIMNEMEHLSRFIKETADKYNKNEEIINELIQQTQNSHKVLAEKIKNNVGNFIKING